MNIFQLFYLARDHKDVPQMPAQKWPETRLFIILNATRSVGSDVTFEIICRAGAARRGRV